MCFADEWQRKCEEHSEQAVQHAGEYVQRRNDRGDSVRSNRGAGRRRAWVSFVLSASLRVGFECEPYKSEHIRFKFTSHIKMSGNCNCGRLNHY